MEELVAELGSTFLSADLELTPGCAQHSRSLRDPAAWPLFLAACAEEAHHSNAPAVAHKRRWKAEGAFFRQSSIPLQWRSDDSTGTV